MTRVSEGPHPDEGLVHAWLDGALSTDEAAALDAHVRDCRDCSAVVAEARGLIAASSRIVSALDDVPAGVIPKVAPGAAPSAAHTADHTAAHTAVRDATRVVAGDAVARPSWMRGSRGRGVAAAALLFVAVGSWVATNGSEVSVRSAESGASLDSNAGPAAPAQPDVVPSAASDARGSLTSRAAATAPDSSARAGAAAMARLNPPASPELKQRTADASPRMEAAPLPSPSRMAAADAAVGNVAGGAAGSATLGSAIAAGAANLEVRQRTDTVRSDQSAKSVARQQSATTTSVAATAAPPPPPSAPVAERDARREFAASAAAMRAPLSRAGVAGFEGCYALGDSAGLGLLPRRVRLTDSSVLSPSRSEFLARAIDVGDNTTALRWWPIDASTLRLVARRGSDSSATTVRVAARIECPPTRNR